MQISEQVIEALNYLCEKIGITIDWTSANILPYLSVICEKYIHYEIAISVVWLLIGIIGIIIFIGLIRYLVEEWEELCFLLFDSFSMFLFFWNRNASDNIHMDFFASNFRHNRVLYYSREGNT